MSKRKITCHDIPPFESIDDANKMAEAMSADVQALREKHNCHHLLVLAVPMIRTEEGENVYAAQVCLRHGSDAELLLQVAALYGRLKNEYTAILENALSRKRKD